MSQSPPAQSLPDLVETARRQAAALGASLDAIVAELDSQSPTPAPDEALPADLPTHSVRTGQAAFFEAFDPQSPPERFWERPWVWTSGHGGVSTRRGFGAAFAYDVPGEYVARLNGTPIARLIVSDWSDLPTRRVRTVAGFREAAAEMAIEGGTIEVVADLNVDEPIRLGDRTRVLGVPITASRQPTLRSIRGPAKHASQILNVRGDGCVIRGLRFDSLHKADGDRPWAVEAVKPWGRGTTVRECSFGHVGFGVQGNARPRDVLIDRCRIDDVTGLRAYLAWVNGRNWCVYGCEASNSAYEHIVRGSEYDFLAVDGCGFTNLHERSSGVKGDVAKGCVTAQAGRYAYVADCRLTLDSQHMTAAHLAPLGDADGLKKAGDRLVGAVIEDCTIVVGHVRIGHGTEGFRAEGLTFVGHDKLGLPPGGLIVAGAGKGYDRTSKHGVIRRVTGSVSIAGDCVDVLCELEGGPN